VENDLERFGVVVVVFDAFEEGTEGGIGGECLAEEGHDD
jgi:hypothetical protein